MVNINDDLVSPKALRRAQTNKEARRAQADKRSSVQASEQASEREGGPTSVQASKLNAENSARFVESAQAQLVRKPKRAR